MRHPASLLLVAIVATSGFAGNPLAAAAAPPPVAAAPPLVAVAAPPSVSTAPPLAAAAAPPSVAAAPPLVAVAAPLSVAAAAHPFDVHDLVAMRRLSDPRVSPDGSQVVYTLSTVDLAANRRRTDLWIAPVAGGEPRQLTTDPASDGSAVWAPDGSAVYFLSSRQGAQNDASSQVWRQRIAGGAAEQVTHLPLDVESFRLSPDGRTLVVSMQVFPDCPQVDCTVQRLAADAKGPATGHLYHQLFVRHWDTWADGRRSHLFALPVDGSAAPRDLMPQLVADVPSKPFGGVEEYAFTPDGNGVIFSARMGSADEPWSTNFDLYVAPLDGAQAPRNLTADNPAWDTQPVFSPDGTTLAYLAMERAGFESDRYRIVRMAWPSGAKQVLTESWDRSPSQLFWSADGATIYATAPDVGQESLFAVDAGSGAVQRLVSQGTVRSPQLAGTGRILYGLDTLTHPVDLWTYDLASGRSEQVTHVNDDLLAQVAMGEPEQFSFVGADGDTVYGYLVKPANFDPAKKWPIAFLIHGGPQGSFSNNFHYRWNAETYAGAGYAALMIDFHGSTGYGQAFTDAIRGDWGGKPLVDLQKGLDAALERYPWLDGDRACALGASYGGFMVYWIAGNWPDRFKCLVDHDGVFDQRMMYYSTEELWFPEWEFSGPYWENPESYEAANPVRFVDRWKTPMLVVHGAHDYRIPETQGLGAFTALQRRGIPSEFLYFPDESHFVTKPANSILWHDTVNGWLDRWLKQQGAAGGGAGQ